MTCKELEKSIEDLKSQILKLKWGRATSDNELRLNVLPQLLKEYSHKKGLYNYIMFEKQWDVHEQ
jgi:hypothetical protein